MMLNYEDALAYINSFINAEKSPDFSRQARLYNLNRISRLLTRLGNPHRYLKVVHVAGSKGKGSTATFIASILTRAGFKTGLFTSPHLVTPRERCRIDSELVSTSAFVDCVNRLKPEIEAVSGVDGIGDVSFFEIYTALAFAYFADETVDFAVVEVGLGGRLDATNIVSPLVSVITQISLEHTTILGNTHEAIAKEKAEIIKPNHPVVLAPQTAEAQSVFEVVAADRNAPISSVGRDVELERGKHDIHGQTFDVHTRSESYPNLFLPLLGAHQAINAATAVACVERIRASGYEIPTASVYDGLKEARLPGRLQLVCGQPPILLDGAHSPASVEALRDTIHEVFRYEELILIVGFMRDKDLREIGETLCPMAGTVIATKMRDNPRAVGAGEIARTWSDIGGDICVSPSVGDAIARAKSVASSDDLICITGSMILIGEAMQALGL
ncbi:MAG: bifunctional folylpolyglutamate synthase/dihydrofolate synthase [Candidatus Poribacteria bacterium]|nr:bifunctional folylpolyglutamate synthase/dihydrofolate synthase [Candidatus Poribacteria bacterium]